MTYGLYCVLEDICDVLEMGEILRCCASARARLRATQDRSQSPIIVWDDDSHAKSRAHEKDENSPNESSIGGR